MWKVTEEHEALPNPTTDANTSIPEPTLSPEADPATTPSDLDSEQVPPPQPLTPERAAAENRRNDLFIAAAVVVLAFLLSSFKVAESNVWLHLRSGWRIHQEGIPTFDPFTYTVNDRR